MPKIAKAMCSEVPTPAAAMAAGPNGPTMIVSTTPMNIHPSSASTTGIATRSMGGSSERIKERWITGWR